MFQSERARFRDKRDWSLESRAATKIVALCILWSCASVSLGANWFFQPRASIGVGYEENADLVEDTENPVNTNSYDVEASVRGGRLTERSRLIGSLGADVSRHPGNERLDSDNLIASLDTVYLATELDQLGLDFRFVKDTSRRSELTTTGNTLENVPRNLVEISPFWQRQLTERSSIGLGYSYEQVTFDDNLSGLVDYRQDDIEGSYTFQLTERLESRGTIGVVSYHPDDDVSYVAYDASLGLRYALSETFVASLYVGPQRIDSKTDLADETTSRTASGVLYGFDLSKEFERSRLTLSARRGPVPTGSGEPLLQENLRLGYSYQLSPRLNVTVPIGLYRNETISFGGGVEEEEERRLYFTAEPSLSYQITEDWLITASYRYRYEHLDLEDSSASSNAFFVSLSYVWPTEIPQLSR